MPPGTASDGFIPSDTSCGTASANLVKAVYQDQTFLPVVAISADRSLTSANIPWIFRLPEGTALANAVGSLFSAIEQAGPNRGAIREFLASGKSLAGVRFDSVGEAIAVAGPRGPCSCLLLFCSPRCRKNPYNLGSDLVPGVPSPAGGGSIQPK